MTNNLYSVWRACLVAMALVVHTLGMAQPTPRHEFNFRNDNDLYLLNKQDQYYTNGIFFNIRKAATASTLTSNEANRIWGVTVGQKMYNAYTAHIRFIEEVDRPITAYLFMAANVDRYFTDESFLSLQAEIGTIGQRALGQQFQERIHKVLNLYDIAGWEYQLENAFGADIGLQYGRMFYRNPAQWFDFSGRAEATIGMNRTGLSIAPTLRLGRINRLHQSAYNASRLQADGQSVAKEFFLYYCPQLNWVGYDATLQGGMFLQNKGPVTQQPARLVFYNQIGAFYARNALTLRLQYIFYSKEVPGMFFRHRYGSVGVGVRF